MIDTVRLVLGEYELNEPISFLEEVGSRIKIDKYKSYGNKLVGWLDNMRIEIKERRLWIEGSLSKYANGHNVDGMKYEDIKGAIDSLSNRLGVPLYEARVTRIDVAETFEMKEEVPLYLKRLMYLDGFNHISFNPNCVYFLKDSKKKELQLCFYNKTKEIIDELQEKMLQASSQLNFELAKEYRDLIAHIQHVTSKQHVQFADQIDRDIIGYYQDKGYLSLQLFFMRNGKLLARDLNLVPLDDMQEQITQFIVSFYQENTYPKEILVPGDLDTSLLEEILECKIIKPIKGQKAKLVEMANHNAKEALEKKFLLIEKNQKATIGAIEQLGKKLNMVTPRRIELFDNSNIQGAYAVAGMVCFVDGVPSKKDYRKYKIRTVEGPDDYASMKEVIYRRYYRVLVERLKKPDLIIVDGGKGQIKVAKEVIDSLHLDIKVCGLAKDDSHSTAMLLDSEGQIIEIDKKSELFFLLTRMQDEVHRYAISFHKNVRSKSLFQSVLDDVSGIGPKRKKELLKHFGSVKKLKEASLEQLQQHLPKEVAKELFETLSHTK